MELNSLIDLLTAAVSLAVVLLGRRRRGRK